MSKQREYAIHKAPILTPAFFVVLAVVCIGMALVIYRYFVGIGAVSNLSNGYPWGIWLSYDVATGSAIACGGYVLAVTVYILNNFKYHTMVRSAVLASMFGYSLAGLSVMVDIGRYWNSYGFFMPSRMNPNSALFEVALCIMAYCVVLILEYLPAVFERFADSDQKNSPKLVEFGKVWEKRFSKALFVIVAIGATLPTMHQSSLGTLYVLMGYKLDPMWQTGFLPLLFLSNAYLMGFSITAFETVLSTRLLKRPFEKEIVDLSKVIPFIVGFWLIVRVISVSLNGGWSHAFAISTQSIWFWLELILVIVPSLMILTSKYARSESGIFLIGMMLLIGGGMYRIGVYNVGFNPGADWNTYFPSVAEFLITLSFIAIEVLGYMVLVKLTPVLPNLENHGHKH